MKPGINSILLAIISLVAFSCDDNDGSESMYDSQRILECHNKTTWGFDETKNKIVGTWEWKHAEYVYAVPPDDDLTGLNIEFRDDGTGTLRNNKVAPLEFTWSIGAYGTYYGFTTEPLIPQISGQILFCDNIMECGIAASGLADGVNNFYEKVN